MTPEEKIAYVLRQAVSGFLLTYLAAAVLFLILIFGIMPLLSTDY